MKKIISNGYWNLSVSRNTLNNEANKYTDNKNPSESSRTFKINSNETENKFRWDVTKNLQGATISYGLIGQYVQFDNSFFQVLDQSTTPSITINSNSKTNFIRYGGFAQAGTRLLNDKLSLSDDR